VVTWLEQVVRQDPGPAFKDAHSAFAAKKRGDGAVRKSEA
jgi:hypothetical protein